jgi:hypothetical protein
VPYSKAVARPSSASCRKPAATATGHQHSTAAAVRSCSRSAAVSSVGSFLFFFVSSLFSFYPFFSVLRFLSRTKLAFSLLLFQSRSRVCFRSRRTPIETILVLSFLFFSHSFLICCLSVSYVSRCHIYAAISKALWILPVPPPPPFHIHKYAIQYCYMQRFDFLMTLSRTRRDHFDVFLFFFTFPSSQSSFARPVVVGHLEVYHCSFVTEYVCI